MSKSKKETSTNEQLITPHICGVKLVSGEDIICLLSFEPDNARYLMQNPGLVFLKESVEENKFQVALSPFLPAAHGGQISIVTDKLVAMYAPNMQIVEQYKQHFRHPGMADLEKSEQKEQEEAPKFTG